MLKQFMAQANMEVRMTTDFSLLHRRMRITTDVKSSFRGGNAVSKPENNLHTAKFRITHKLVKRGFELSQEGVLQMLDIPLDLSTVSKSATHDFVLNHFLHPQTACQLVEEMFSRFYFCDPDRKAFLAASITSQVADIAQLAAKEGSVSGREFEFEVLLESHQRIISFDGLEENTISVVAALALTDVFQILKVKSFPSSEFRDSMCVVCQENFSAGEQILEMPCSHIFHANCLLEWLEEQHICPLCRFELPQQQ